MPYTAQRPPTSVQKALGHLPHAIEVWVAAFNSAFAAYDPAKHEAESRDAYAFSTAWAAVRNAGFSQDESGRWYKARETKAEQEREQQRKKRGGPLWEDATKSQEEPMSEEPAPRTFRQFLVGLHQERAGLSHSETDETVKYNPYHEPAGSGKGGQFAAKPGGGGGTGRDVYPVGGIGSGQLMVRGVLVSTGRLPDPLAANVGCRKHGDVIWAVCDCNPRYYANVHDQEGMIGMRRDDFKAPEKAEDWAIRTAKAHPELRLWKERES